MSDTTRILADLSRGDATAAERLWPHVYEELRLIARQLFRQQPQDHTLQPTALVHEVYLRLVGQDGADFRGRAHFMAVAARAMRHILIDQARRRQAVRHGGGVRRMTLNEAIAPASSSDVDLLELDDVLRRLTDLEERKGRVAELRLFGGLTIDQTAEALGIARSTVSEDWRIARAWIGRELREGSGAA